MRLALRTFLIPDDFESRIPLSGSSSGELIVAPAENRSLVDEHRPSKPLPRLSIPRQSI
jgi:hypothetical protein